MVLSLKSILYLLAITSLFALGACAAKQAAPDKNGVVHVNGLLPDRSHDEFKFSDGTVRTHGNPDVTHWAEVTYNDGESFSILFDRPFGYGQSTWEAFDATCKNNLNCPFILERGNSSAIVPLDGQDWMDSELWMLIRFDAYDYKNAIKYQACRDDHFYSAPDSKTLMDVVDKVDQDPAAAKSDPEVTKYLLTDDALVRRLPVCITGVIASDSRPHIPHPQIRSTCGSCPPATAI